MEKTLLVSRSKRAKSRSYYLGGKKRGQLSNVMLNATVGLSSIFICEGGTKMQVHASGDGYS